MPILKPDSALKSWSRKLSQRQSVRLPWAIVVPNGLSLFARSTSTWIHWWSPETSANLSMSSWVTSRQSLGPIVCPMRAFSSSIPFTVVGVLMAGSISGVVVPGLGLERGSERLLPRAQQRRTVSDEDGVEAELEEWLQCRVEAIAVEARDLRVDLLARPHPQRSVRLHDGVPERERPVARDVERHLVAAWLADRVCGHATGQRHTRLDLAEGGRVLEPLRRGAVTVDRGLGVVSVAPPELLGAAHVVRDRDEDGEPVPYGPVDRLQYLAWLRRQQRIDQEDRVARLGGERRNLSAELAGVPFGMSRRPAPEPVA